MQPMKHTENAFFPLISKSPYKFFSAAVMYFLTKSGIVSSSLAIISMCDKTFFFLCSLTSPPKDSSRNEVAKPKQLSKLIVSFSFEFSTFSYAGNKIDSRNSSPEKSPSSLYLPPGVFEKIVLRFI